MPSPDLAPSTGATADGDVLTEVEAGIDRLYATDFCGRMWLSTWAAQVGTVCLELAQLRSDLAHAQAERDRLLEVSTAAIEGCSEAAVEQKAERDQLRAQVTELQQQVRTLEAERAR